MYTQKCDRGLQFPLLEICLTHSQEQPHHYYLRPPHPRSHLLQRHYHGITCDVVTHKLIFIHACKAVLHTLCFATQIHATFSSARRPYISCSASRITHSLLLARWIQYPLCIPQRGPYILHSCPWGADPLPRGIHLTYIFEVLNPSLDCLCPLNPDSLFEVPLDLEVLFPSLRCLCLRGPDSVPKTLRPRDGSTFEVLIPSSRCHRLQIPSLLKVPIPPGTSRSQELTPSLRRSSFEVLIPSSTSSRRPSFEILIPYSKPSHVLEVWFAPRGTPCHGGPDSLLETDVGSAHPLSLSSRCLAMISLFHLPFACWPLLI